MAKISKAVYGTTEEEGCSTSRVMTFRLNIEFNVELGNLFITVPVVQLSEMDLPFLSEEVGKWSIENKIDENVYASAYDAARKAFLKEIQTATTARYIADHMKPIE